MDRLAEQLEIIHGSLARRAVRLRRRALVGRASSTRGPSRSRTRCRCVMGGAAGPRGAALAARFAAEYNVVHATPADAAAAARARCDAACEQAGRDPATLRFSLMHGFLIGADEDDCARARRAARGVAGRARRTLDELRRDWLAGTPDEVVARLREYEAAGVERVMLQHLLHRDIEALELIAAEVLPAFA